MAISCKYTKGNTGDILYTARTSLFLSCSDLFLPTYCRCSGLLLQLITLNETHQSRYDSSARGISPTQRPLPDNTQYSQEIDRLFKCLIERAS